MIILRQNRNVSKESLNNKNITPLKMKKNKDFEKYIDDKLENYMINNDFSMQGLFMISLIYELGRIADALEGTISVAGTMDTYEQNIS